jgi:hypothetical protein
MWSWRSFGERCCRLGLGLGFGLGEVLDRDDDAVDRANATAIVPAAEVMAALYYCWD